VRQPGGDTGRCGGLSSAISNPLHMTALLSTPRSVELFIHRQAVLRRCVLLIDPKGKNLTLAKTSVRKPPLNMSVDDGSRPKVLRLGVIVQ
jgi:hypothetical protein